MYFSHCWSIAVLSKNAVIVGAGPGGLACARLLAEHGLDVLVLERKKEAGPKVCGGGITWDSRAVDEVDPALEREQISLLDAVDAALAKGEKLGSLAGVPFTVKENIDFAGWGWKLMAFRTLDLILKSNRRTLHVKMVNTIISQGVEIWEARRCI